MATVAAAAGVAALAGIFAARLPGPAPVRPSARMRRSTVHRATGSSGWTRLMTFHIFRAPYTPMFSSCSATRRSSMTASRTALAEGGRALRA